MRRLRRVHRLFAQAIRAACLAECHFESRGFAGRAETRKRTRSSRPFGVTNGKAKQKQIGCGGRSVACVRYQQVDAERCRNNSYSQPELRAE